MLLKFFSDLIQNHPNLSLSKDEMSIFRDLYLDLANNSSLEEMDEYVQHGNTSTLLHSVAVAHFSYLFAKAFRIRVDARSLITGALLHDYYLYDWHVYDRSHSFHGFRHPFTSLRNARKIRKLNAIEENIIVRHMFPLIPIPPIYRESLIVCIVDKICSLYETFSRQPYRNFSCEALVLKTQKQISANI
ncbi:MAG: hypothetical protein Q4A75_03690 [Peptostreptococcaceae bacterium]|nr:hypothetical protein [Peptostreptococcaceae bacterium]